MIGPTYKHLLNLLYPSNSTTNALLLHIHLLFCVGKRVLWTVWQSLRTHFLSPIVLTLVDRGYLARKDG